MVEIAPLIVRIAVPSPLRRTFDYLVPSDLALSRENSAIQPGCRVIAPFGKRQITGLIIELADSSELPLDRLKPISQLLDSQPLLPASLFKLFIWAANYYQHPIGDALFTRYRYYCASAAPHKVSIIGN